MQKTINIEPFNCKIQGIKGGKFTLVFEDHNKFIKINLENWWIEYIAEELHKVLDVNQKKIDSLRQAMQGKDSA